MSFAGFVVCMGNERILKRVMLGEVVGGKGYFGGQERDWVGCLEMHLLLVLHLPTEAQNQTLTATNQASGVVQTNRQVEEKARDKCTTGSLWGRRNSLNNLPVRCKPGINSTHH